MESTFFCYKGHLCYIVPKKDYVYLRLVQGAHLSNEKKYLVGKGKQVRHIKFFSLKNLLEQEKELTFILQEACLYNELYQKCP